MACINKDQPLRIRFSEKGVVHAAATVKYGGFQRGVYIDGKHTLQNVPVEDRINVACRYRPLSAIEGEQFLTDR